MADLGLVYEDFSGKVGDTFVIAEDGFPAIGLTLIECELLAARQLPPNGRPAYSLVFVAATARMLEQRLYCLDHPQMGKNVVFIVPVGKEARGFLYQALFN